MYYASSVFNLGTGSMQGIKWFGPVLAMFLLVCNPAIAKDEDIYTIQDVWVEKKAKNATDARKYAVSEAGLIAYDKLIRKIISDDDYEKMPVLSHEEISNLVKGYEVKEEKIGSKSYEAHFSVSFFSHMVKKLLEENEISIVSDKGEPILVLPVYHEGSDAVLWRDINPWWEAWEKSVSDFGPVPMILPLGDIEDIGVIKVEDIFSQNKEAFNELAKKYEVKDILIAEAEYDDTNFDGKPSLKVTMKFMGKNNSEKSNALYESDYGEDKAELLASAAHDIVSKIRSNRLNEISPSGFGQDGMPVQSKEKSIVASIAISDLKDWLAVRDKLSQIDIIEKVEVLGLSPNEAKVKMFYGEDLSTVSYFLGLKGLNLQKKDGTPDWRIEQE